MQRGGRRAALVWSWVVLLLLLAARTVRRNQDWQDEESLYRSGISICPPKGKCHHVWALSSLQACSVIEDRVSSKKSFNY